jgi:non-ribosomal peptide synthetase component F
MASLDSASTLLDLFENIARSEVDLDAVECGEERWTYGELDVISTGLAVEMHRSYGRKPVVAIVSENHPYTLATVLATWKLGGVVAPLDSNVPRDIMESMLLDIKPTFVLVPSNQIRVQKVITGSVKCYLFF